MQKCSLTCAIRVNPYFISFSRVHAAVLLIRIRFKLFLLGKLGYKPFMSSLSHEVTGEKSFYLNAFQDESAVW